MTFHIHRWAFGIGASLKFEIERMTQSMWHKTPILDSTLLRRTLAG